jgi:cellulose synthase/poly-beta-1,6-N-acetylglucosamine synthase-like glycosyltransferase
MEPQTAFSIIIPFRNEAKNLPELLNSISEINYPTSLFEILLINDESSDDSLTILQGSIQETILDIKILDNVRLSNSPKKDAIVTGIKESKCAWILTTDADCTFSSNWLKTLNAFILNKKSKMVAGPVTYNISNSFFERFQYLDFLSLIGATIGGFGIGKPFLCNGANLAYQKKVFTEIQGFKGNENIASGDDIFLLEKVQKKYPKDLHYLKSQEALVLTHAEPTLSSLISQRRRWAAKTSSYSSSFGKTVGAIVLLMNFSMLAGLFLSIFGVITFKTIGYVFLIKFWIDLWLIQKTTKFMGTTRHLKTYLLVSLIYPFFNVYIALTAWFGGYSWKGRTFKK